MGGRVAQSIAAPCYLELTTVASCDGQQRTPTANVELVGFEALPRIRVWPEKRRLAAGSTQADVPLPRDEASVVRYCIGGLVDQSTLWLTKPTRADRPVDRTTRIRPASSSCRRLRALASFPTPNWVRRPLGRVTIAFPVSTV